MQAKMLGSLRHILFILKIVELYINDDRHIGEEVITLVMCEQALHWERIFQCISLYANK